MATIPLTRRGAEKLKEELHRLKTVERHAVIQAIAEARAQGDLSENAEYEAAKDKQGFIEGRILEIESKLAAAQVIDPSTLDADGRVVFGSTVDLEDEDSGAKVTYQIVGDDEADLKQGLISISSPIARALIGKDRRRRRRGAGAGRRRRATRSSASATREGVSARCAAPAPGSPASGPGAMLGIGVVAAPTLFAAAAARPTPAGSPGGCSRSKRPSASCIGAVLLLVGLQLGARSRRARPGLALQRRADAGAGRARSASSPATSRCSR